MALAPLISFTDPRTFPPLLRLSNGVKRLDVRRVMGRAIATALRQNFITLDRERANRLGGRRTHFWGDVRRSVQQPELTGGDGVKVAINHVGIAQQYFGGWIDAAKRGKKWLTIPARAEAHGKRAGEFDDLHFVYFRPDLAALVQNDQTSLGGRVHGSVTETGRRKGATTGGGIFYWLKPRIFQKGDKEVLPSDEALSHLALEAGEEFLQTLVAREKSP